MRVWNLVSHSKGRTEAGGVREEYDKENYWERRMRKLEESGKCWIIRKLFVFIARYFSGDLVKENTMGEMMYVAGTGEKGNLKGMFVWECLRFKSSRGGLSNGLNLKS
jgi:hypothetical protein